MRTRRWDKAGGTREGGDGENEVPKAATAKELGVGGGRGGGK